MNTVLQIPELFFSMKESSENSLSKEIEELTNSLSYLMNSDIDLESQINFDLRERVFNFRIKVIREMGKEYITDLLNSGDNFFEKFFIHDERYSTLNENANYLLRTAKNIISQINESGLFTTNDISTESINIPDYKDLFDTLMATNISKQEFTIMRFIDYSISVEIGLIAYSLVSSLERPLSDLSLFNLEFFLVDSAQMYSVNAFTLGLIKGFNPTSNDKETHFSKEEIEENRLMAEEGFSDWANMVLNA